MKEKMLEKAQDLMRQMEFLLEDTGTAREAEVNAAIEADKAKDKMLQTHRDLTLELSVSPDIAGSVDPRTGKANKEWAQYVLDEKLERDDRYLSAAADMYEAQERLMRLRSHIVQNVEILNVAKTEARLVTAILGAIGNE